MDGIRIAAAMAALVLGTGAPKDERVGAAPGPEKKIECKDGTWVDPGDKACENHGGRGRPPAAEEGPARKSQPPDLRGHDTPAHASPYSAFGGKAQAAKPNRPGHRKAVTPKDRDTVDRDVDDAAPGVAAPGKSDQARERAQERKHLKDRSDAGEVR